jgi:hypothetical protein
LKILRIKIYIKCCVHPSKRKKTVPEKKRHYADNSRNPPEILNISDDVTKETTKQDIPVMYLKNFVGKQ